MRLSERQMMFAALAGLALACLAAFGPALWNGFVRWDDFHLIVDNPLIASHSWRIFASYDPELYIPLTLLTYQIEHLLFGFDSFIFHLDNLLIHVAGTWLAFGVLNMLLRDAKAAFLGALIFAIHPVQTEAVAWVSGRKELLFTAFLLGSVLLYLRGGRRANLWSLILFACALLSKPTALVLPLLLPVLDYWRDGEWSKKSVTGNWPYWLLAFAAGVIALFGRGDTLALLSPFETILLAFRSTAFYLGKFFVPLNFSAIYPAPSDLTLASMWQWLSILLVIGLGVAAWFSRKKYPELLTGVAWFFLALLPSFLAYAKSNAVTLGADRYMYLPLLGLAFLIAALAQRFSRKTALALAALLILAFLPLSRGQADTWRDTETLFNHVLKLYPESAIAHNNIGFQLMQAEKLEEAQGHFEKAVTENPDYADAHLNLGVVTAKRADFVNAERCFRKAIELNPNLIQAKFSLAGISLKRDDLNEAARLYRETLDLNPDYVPALWQLTQVLFKLNKLDEASTVYKRLLDIDPSYQGRIPELDVFLR